MPKQVIEHRGRIDAIEGDRIRVRFQAISACSTCHARSVCTASGMEHKEVDVTADGRGFQVGEEVSVLLKQSLGFKALFYGYVFPFFLVITALFSLTAVFDSEVVVGLLSLAILVPYFWMIHYRRHGFERSFAFVLQKRS